MVAKFKLVKLTIIFLRRLLVLTFDKRAFQPQLIAQPILYVAAVNNTTIGISLGTKPCIPRVVLGRCEQILRYSNNIQILFE